jgi:hypothetical protein
MMMYQNVDRCDRKKGPSFTIRPFFPAILTFLVITLQHNPTDGATLTGLFMNELRQIQPYISVEFYSAKKDSLIKRVDADVNGCFRVDSIFDGEYRLKIPAHDTFPVQWYSLTGNTRFSQYSLWVGSAMQWDTLKIMVTMHPMENPPNSSILVQVLDSTNQTMKKLSVELLRQSDSKQIGYIYNDTSYTTIFTGVQPGEYTVHVNAPPYPPQFYGIVNNSSTAKSFFPVTINEQKSMSIKLTMTPMGNGQLKGRCYSEASIPLAGLLVALFRISDTLNPLYRDTTNDVGNFSFDNIIEENYFLQIQGNSYPVQWYSRQRSATVLNREDPIFTSSAATTDTMKIYVSLNPINNAPGAVVKIRVYSPEGTVEKVYGKAALVAIPSRKYTVMKIDSTTGLYVSVPVAEGLYGLGFTIPGYPYQYYGPNGNTAQEQYRFTLGKNETLFIETNLKRTFTDTISTNYGYVSGSVRDSVGPLNGVSVTIFEKSGNMIGSAITDSMGKYTAIRVQNVQMYLRVDAPGYPQQYWVRSNTMMTSNLSSMNFFTVPTMSSVIADVKITKAPEVHYDIDTTGVASTVVSGQVNSTTGPIRGARVMLIENTATVIRGLSPQYIWSNIQVYTDSLGKYTFNNVPKGSFLAVAVADSANFIAQYYKNADLPENALPIRVETGSVTGIGFTLRSGGILKGIVTDSVNGSAIPGVRITIDETNSYGRHFETKSDASGSWQIRGIPSGEFKVFVEHGLFLQVGSKSNTVQIIESKTVVLDPIRLIKGGIIQGTVVSSSSIPAADSLFRSIRGSIALFSQQTDNSTKMYPDYRASVQFINNTTSSISVSFVSLVCPPGTYKALFVPDPVCWGDSLLISGTENVRRSFGYTFLNKDTSLSSTITITSGDTCKNNIIEMRGGYSVFGSLTADSVIVNSYNVNVYRKLGTTLFWISSSNLLKDHTFEIPGLVNGEQYFFQLWADGFPNQFWSASGKNTTNPSAPFTLDISAGRLQLKIYRQPEGTSTDINQYISLWPPVDTNGMVKLQWTAGMFAGIDTFFLYTKNKQETNAVLATIPAITGTSKYEYFDRRELSGWNEYCVTGRNPSMVVRSDIQKYDAREKSVAKGNLWIDTYGSRYGIAVEWGIADTIRFTTSDSISLYKRTSGGSFQKLFSRSAFETHLNDWNWSRSDSLKTFDYYVEISSRVLRSAIKSYTLDGSFFKLLPKELKVGTGQLYTTIQGAVDAATENDNIVVLSGTYNEQINLKGKKLHLYGDWKTGYPPVIDASGGTAFTIPCVSQSGNDGGVEISGFKFTNAANAIIAQAHANINKCLFVNVMKSVKVAPDSSSIALAIRNNPFFENGVNVNLNNCTFIASKAQASVVSIHSSGYGSTGSVAAIYDDQVLFPLKTYCASAGITRSLVAYYGSTGGASTIPIQITGISSDVWIDNCAFWQTPYQTSTEAIKVYGDMITFDPLFKDQINYMYNDSSKLALMGIGYGVNYNNGIIDRKKVLSSIRDLVIFNRSVNKIELQWSAAPITDSIIRYRIYRAPGDPTLFYVNSDSLWDLVASGNAIPSQLDTFSTNKLSFVDSTVQPGQPYIYVVCAVDQYGNESAVRIPGSKPISTYFSNVVKYATPVKADVWTMISPWGQTAIDFSNNPNVKIFQWDPQRPADKLLSHYVTVTSMVPGNGYWFKSLKDTVLSISVNEPGNFAKVQDTLKCRIAKGADGWNQVSSPYPHRVNPALPSKYVFWEWMADSLGYKRVSVMEPWKAYWVYTDKDTAFSVNSGNNAVSTSSSLSKRTALASWELVVSLKSSSGTDPENVCGVVPSLSMSSFNGEIPEPPQPFSGNNLYFVKNDSGQTGTSLQKLSYQYQQSSTQPDEKIEWTVGIHSPNGPSTITVSGIEKCPSELGIFWIYKGAVTDLRNSPSVTIECASEESFGYIVATANPKELALYSAVFGLRAPYPNPSSGRVVIEYVLPYQWAENGLRTGGKAQNVSIILYDLSGKMVRTLFNSGIPAGKHTLMWDGRSDGGSQVGSGVYILRFKSGKFIRNLQLFRVR